MVWYWYGAVFHSFYYLIKEMTQCYLNSLERHPVLKIYHYKAFFVRLSYLCCTYYVVFAPDLSLFLL